MEGSSRHGEPLNALSHNEAVALAGQLGVQIYWDWEAPRTFEGYYQMRGGVDTSIARARAFAPYSDMIWMETAVPSLEEAKVFSDGVKALFPNKFLAYNLSPSFNWDKFGMTDEQLASYQDELGQMGYVWQFITLAGFHGDALFAKTFAEDFAKRKMLAYVEGVQRQERKKKVGALTHQQWSGVELIGSQQDAATSGRTSTGATGKKSTEHQFSKNVAEKDKKDEPKH
jgi:isocitrate lyase